MFGQMTSERTPRLWVLVAGLALAGCTAAPSLVSSAPPTAMPSAPAASCGGGPQASGSCVVPLTPAPGAMSREAAIAAALAAVPGASSAWVEWSSLSPSPFVEPAGSGPVVWEVRLAGRQLPQPTCPADWLSHYPSPSDAPCLDQDHGLIVVLDQFSGAFLGWAH